MLPDQPLTLTNFVNGMKFNPEMIGVNDAFYDAKLSLLSLAGHGRGVFAGYAGSLTPKIEGGLLVVSTGAALDDQGNLIFVPATSQPLLPDLSNRRFTDKSTVYVYIRFREVPEDLRPARNEELSIHYKKKQTYEVVLDTQHRPEPGWVELARILVDHSKSEFIEAADNPFLPGANQLDIRFAPKIVTAPACLSQAESEKIASVFQEYGKSLSALARKKKLFSASTAAGYAFAAAAQVEGSQVTSWKLFAFFNYLLELTLEMADEHPALLETPFWKNVRRLEQLFAGREESEGERIPFDLSYYSILLDHENSFFFKVLYHFRNAARTSMPLAESAPEEAAPPKNHLIVGTTPDCDIVMDQDDVSKEHLRITRFKTGYFLEDLGSAQGTFVNSIRLEPGVKQFVTPGDTVLLGGAGAVLNLNQSKIQDLP